MDQEKAFDRADHHFLFQTVRHLNFGDYFISWINFFEGHHKSGQGKWFSGRRNTITRGVRHGDPLSALLYIIVPEVLGDLIRTNKDIKGITIKEIEQKILQYADDTQIVVTNDESIAEVFRQLKEYEPATGAKVTSEKLKGSSLVSEKTGKINFLIVGELMIKFFLWDCGQEIKTLQR